MNWSYSRENKVSFLLRIVLRVMWYILPVIILPTVYQIGNVILIFLQLGKEEKLTVNSCCFRCYAKYNDFQVGKYGYNFKTGHITMIIDQVSCHLFANGKKFCEYYI